MEEIEVKIFKDITNLKFNAKFAKGLVIMIMNATIETIKEKRQALLRKKKGKMFLCLLLTIK